MADDQKAPLLANNFDDEGRSLQIAAPKGDPALLTDVQHAYNMKDDLSKAQAYLKEMRPSFIDTPFQGSSLAITKDERFYVFGSREGRLGIVDRDTKSVILDKDLKQGPVYSMTLISNDKYLLSGGAQKTIKKFSYPDITEVDEFVGHTDEINYIVASKDEKFLYSCADDGTVRQWNLEEGGKTESNILFEHDRVVYCVDVSHDGKHVASASSDCTAKVYSFDCNAVVAELTGATDSLWCVKISAGKTFVAAGSEDSVLYMWEFGTWVRTRNLIGHTARVRNLDISNNDAFIVSAGLDHKIKIWDLKGFKKEITLSGHSNWVKFALLSKSQDHLFSCSDDCKVGYWKIPNFDTQFTFQHSKAFSRIDSFNNFGYARTEDEIVALNLNNGREEFSISLREGEVLDYFFSKAKDKIYVFVNDSGDENYSVFIYDANLGNFLERKTFKTERVTSVLLLPNDTQVIFGHSIRVSIFDIETGTEYHKFRSHKDEVLSLVSSWDSTFFVSRDSSNLVKFHDLIQKKELVSLEVSEEVSGLYITLDNAYLLVQYTSNTLEVFSTKRYISLKTLDGISTSEIVFLNDRRTIAYHTENDIVFLDLRNFQILTKIHFKSQVKYFTITQNEQLIMFTSDRSSTIFTSPFHCKELKIYGDSDRTLEFIDYACKITQPKFEYKPEFDYFLIEPFHINALHLYAYNNQSENLEKAILNRSPFFNSRTRHTALEISIEKRFMDCVEAIYNGSKKRLDDEGDEHAFYYFGDSLIALNYSGYDKMDEIYEYSLLKSTDSKLPKFVDENLELPIELNSESPVVDPSEFEPGTFTEEGTAVIFARSSFRISLNMGSQDSTDLLESIIECPNELIYSTRMIQNILHSKWKVVRTFLSVQALFYGLYLVLLSVYASEYYESKFFFIFPFALSCVLFIYEGLQMYYSGLEYLEDPWNYIDITRAGLLFWYFIDFNFEINYYHRETFIVLVLFSWLRGISYFSISGKLRYLIKLIIEATIDISSFFVILFYSTVAFALIYQSLHRFDNVNNLGFWDYFLNAFKLNLGELDTGEAQGVIGWVLFVIVSIINPVIMLNLLISIMGDTYGRVKEGRIVADARQMASMILEVEGIMGWKRNLNEKFYMKLVCEESYLIGLGGGIEDKIQEISTKLQGLLDNFNIMKGNILTSIQSNKEAVLNRISSIQPKGEEPS